MVELGKNVGGEKDAKIKKGGCAFVMPVLNVCTGSDACSGSGST